MSSTQVQPLPTVSIPRARAARTAENWWLLLLRGIAGIAFGVLGLHLAGPHPAESDPYVGLLRGRGWRLGLMGW